MEGSTRKEKKPGERQYSSPAVRDALARTQQSLAERGQRITELGEATSQMESDASNFATLARNMREREEKKKWYEF